MYYSCYNHGIFTVNGFWMKMSLNEEKKKIYEIIKDHGPTGIAQIDLEQKLNISHEETTKIINELFNKGYIDKTKADYLEKTRDGPHMIGTFQLTALKK